jgi:carbonic anhydrase
MNRFLCPLLGALCACSLAASGPETEKKLGPREALWRLRQGNQAYVAGRGGAAVPPARRSALVAGQHPYAVVMTCADSRVPPEYIFHEGLGNLFVVRVAGVVADAVVTGSVEYAVEHLHTPLVVVMGHTRCGAVKAAMESRAPAAGAPPGPEANLEAILSLLRPGFHRSDPQSDPWRTAVFGGVEQSIADLLRLSRILPEMEKAGHVGIVGAVYELETGKVAFSDMLPAEVSVAARDGDHLLKWQRASAASPAPVRRTTAVSHTAKAH